MGFYVSPGVYVRERDISNLIPNIATTSAALVGYSTRGSTKEVKLISSAQQFLQEYGNPIPGQHFHYSALAFLENGNKLYTQRVANGALYGGVNVIQAGGQGATAGLSTGLSDTTFQPVVGQDVLFTVFAKDPGTWNNKLFVQVTGINTTDNTFVIAVFDTDKDGNQVQVESWTVSRQAGLDGYGRQLYLVDRINGFSNYIFVADNTLYAANLLPADSVAPVAMSGGTVGNAIADGDVITALQKFANPDDIDIRMIIGGGQTSVAVQLAMKVIAESRKDCIALFEVPQSTLTSASAMVSWRKTTQNINSSYTALYSGWVTIYDPYNDKVIDVPPTGYVASMYAFNDYVGEPWNAPAGFNRGILNVLGLTNVFTQGERDVLYQNQINPLQTFRGDGNVIWGQKTQQTKASALDRVNVRRLLIVIEKAISSQLRFFCFEPNSDLTRFRVTAMVNEYLSKLAARGAFQNETGDRQVLLELC